MLSLEPKYFIYANQTQVGPFTKNQLVDEIEKQNVGEDAFVWAEGMSDWTKLKRFSELNDYVQYLPQKTSIHNLQMQSDVYANLTEKILANRPFRLKNFAEAINKNATAAKENVAQYANLETIKNLPMVLSRKALAIIAGAGLAVVLSAVGYVQYNKPTVWDQIEATSNQVSEMKSTISQSSADKAFFTIAPLKSAGSDPRFAIATNLPDKTVLKLEFHGIRSTLLGALGAKIETQVSVEEGLALTAPLRRGDGIFLPVGLYKVKITCASCGEGEQTTWLSAPVTIGTFDASYTAELAKFHSLIPKQVESEFVELSESAKFLYEVIFDRTRKRPLSAQKTQMFAQLGEILNEHAEADFNDHYVLAPLYKELRSIHTGLKQMPTDLGSLRRRLDDLQAKQPQIRKNLQSNLTSVLEMKY